MRLRARTVARVTTAGFDLPKPEKHPQLKLYEVPRESRLFEAGESAQSPADRERGRNQEADLRSATMMRTRMLIY